MHPLLDAIAKDLRAWREGLAVRAHDALDEYFAAVRLDLSREDAVRETWLKIGRGLDLQVADLDATTARTLLALVGRPRLAGAVSRVRRQQGTAIAVEYAPSGFAEAALFPPDGTCEPLLCCGPVKPGAVAVQALPLSLGLAMSAPTPVRVGDDEAHLRFEEPIPPGVTGAWATLLSTFTGRRVRVTAPIPADPTQPQEEAP